MGYPCSSFFYPDTMSSRSFPSDERLKSRKAIRTLFASGRSIKQYPLRVLWSETDSDESPIKVAYSAPKRHFRLATRRNRIKRLMREAYRKNKSLIHDADLEGGIHLMFIYLGGREQTYEKIEDAMRNILREVRDAVAEI